MNINIRSLVQIVPLKHLYDFEFVYFVFYISLCMHNVNHVELNRTDISLKNSKVYGPGLHPNFTVPVRYFFIELLNINNNSFSSYSQGLSIQVSGLKQKCRVWYQLLHIKDSLFIARYRLYETCLGLKIDIIYENKNVAEAPYLIEGLIFHEQCYCPKPLKEWLSDLECPSIYPQIIEDLSEFSEIYMDYVLEESVQRFNHPGSYSICHYSIISNEIHRKCLGQYVGFSMFMDEILLSLARKVYLPDMELIVNLGDWPLETRKSEQNPIPIFSWCGSSSTKDIVMPTYDITEATLEMMGRVMVDVLSVMGNSGPPWEEKIQMAFWRGRDSRRERLDLVKIAQQHPHLINASLTNFFFYRGEESEYGPKTEYIPFFDFFKYRYQINVDGTVAAYRMPYLLAGGSLVLKQESEFYEHFYSDLEPMVHYVPVHKNLSNLVNMLKWARSHDAEVKTIADNGQAFALSHLMPKDILCYYALLLKEYAERLKGKSRVHVDMEHIKQPEQKYCLCEEINKDRSPREEL